jgi:uncharacterized membrane protein
MARRVMQMHNTESQQLATQTALQDAQSVPLAGQPPAENWLRDWVFRRNCSMSPRQLLVFFASLCALSLTVAAIAWGVGGALVMPFTGLELTAVAAALFVYARHAADRERVRLSAQQLQVEWESAGVVHSVSFNPHWVRVSLPDSGLIEVSSGGRTAYIGRYARPERRETLVKDLRAALRAL